MNSSPENRTKSMRRPSLNQRPRDIREADGQPQGDWQVQNGQPLGVAARALKGKMLAKTAPAAKGSASQSALLTPDRRFQMK